MDAPDLNFTSQIERLSNLPHREVKGDPQLQSWTGLMPKERERLLASLSKANVSPDRALHILHTVISEIPGPWPASLLRYHTRIVRSLSGSRHGSHHGENSWLIRRSEELVKQSYGSIVDFLHVDDSPALQSATQSMSVGHDTLRDYVARFSLPIQENGHKPIVAVSISNDILFAASLLAVATYYTAVPVDPSEPPQQIESDLDRVHASCVLTTVQDLESLRPLRKWLKSRSVKVFVAEKNGSSLSVRDDLGQDVPPQDRVPNKPDDIAYQIAARESRGTSEFVPFSVHSILSDAFFAIDTWNLTADDACLGMGLAHHVRNLPQAIFAPVLSGGSLIPASDSDAEIFWHTLRDTSPTWFFASCEAHKSILGRASSHPNVLSGHGIRLACSSGINDSLCRTLATLIRDTFRCHVVTLGAPTRYVMRASDKDSSREYPAKSQIVTYCDPRRPSLPDPRGFLGNSNGTGTEAPLEFDAIRSQSVRTLNSQGPSLPDFPLGKNNSELEFGDGFYQRRPSHPGTGVIINKKGLAIHSREVEQAIVSASRYDDSPLHGRVTQALVCPIDHDELGSDVAVVVSTAPGCLRADLQTLSNALRFTSLPKVKWPNFIVYMGDLPPIGGDGVFKELQQQLSLPRISTRSDYMSRHWEATWAQDASGRACHVDIAPCRMDTGDVLSAVQSIVPHSTRSHVKLSPEDGTLELFLAPDTPEGKALDHLWAKHLESLMSVSMHDYMVPSTIHLLSDPLPEAGGGLVDEDCLKRMMAKLDQVPQAEPAQPTQARVLEAFAMALSCETCEVKPDVEFLSMGGDLIKAEKLLSSLRAKFQIDIPASLLTGAGTVKSISEFINTALRKEPRIDILEGCTDTRSSTNLPLLMVQLLPLIVFYPMRRALQWLAQLWILSRTRFWEVNTSLWGRLLNLALSIAASWAFIQLLFPFVGIAFKWIIIGRYREGLYPMWGSYHTRWWMVQKLVCLSGRGIFDLCDLTKSWYCRLMGARVGKGVRLRGVEISEWDLVEICDGVSLDHCLCRPFASEGNTSMYLGRIHIGENASVGALSVIAPGTDILPDTNIGINSSSWEHEDADELKNDVGLQEPIPEPHLILTIFCTWPLWVAGWILSLLPWLAGIYGMLSQKPHPSEVPLRIIITWFQGSPGVAFHYLAVMLQASFSTLIMYGFAVGVKSVLNLLLGDAGKDAREVGGHFRVWRATLMRTLFSQEYLSELNELIGLNHKVRSAVLRRLGAKIGRQVCWPMTGPWITDYHLLDIGDNVTFGSECHLITSDNVGSGTITIRDGAVISDQVCLLPGVDVGERSTLGFGALTRRTKSYPGDTTFVGCRRGDSVSFPKRLGHVEGADEGYELDSPEAAHAPEGRDRQDSDTTLVDEDPPPPRKSSLVKGIATDAPPMPPGADTSPFTRAFYHKEAPYHVWGPPATLAFSATMTLFTAFFWNVPAMSGMKLSSAIFHDHLRHIDSTYDVFVLYPLTAISMAVLTTAFAALAVAIVVAAKWLLIGHRVPGNYDWDKSSYCQRWQLFLAIEKIIQRCYVDRGLLSLLTGTHWLVLYYRALGAKIGKDCALYASGSPSLMLTEPDLISMGDRVAIDDVGIISHIDVRGKFNLDRVEIGDRCVLRSGSSILSGAIMRNDSCLLEHTLVMPGSVVGEKWVMQRRPAERFYSKRIKKSDKLGANVDKKLSV